MESRTTHAKKNIVSGVLNKLIAMLLPFILRTAMIHILGTEYLGLNSLFSSILQVLNLAELGFSQAIIYNMYKPMAEKNTEKVCALLNLYRKIYRIVGIVVFVAGLCLLPFLPHLIKGSYPADINLYVLYLIFLLNTAISYWLFAYLNCILYANQENNVVTNIDSVIKIGSNLVQLILLFLFRNYYIYVMVMPLFTILNNLYTAYLVHKKYPQYQCRGSLDKETKSGIKYNVIGLGIQKLCETSRNSFDSIFVSALLGLTMTAIYNNYYTIFTSLTALVSIMASSLSSGIGNSIATKSVEKNYGDMMKINFIYMWISGFTTVCLLCLFQPFMKLWMGEVNMMGIVPVFCLCFYYYLLRVGDIRASYASGSGIFWQQKYRALGEALCNLVLNLVLGKLFGVTGIIVATAISLFAFNFIYSSQITFKYYFKGISIKGYYLANLRYFLVTAVISAVTFLLTNWLLPLDGFLHVVVTGVICLIVPNILFFAVYYPTKEYAAAMEWFLVKIHKQDKLQFLIPKKNRSVQ